MPANLPRPCPYGGLFRYCLAVEQAHAERIGHGVDVMYEERPHELLSELAAKHVMVEINLTSNDLILGVAGKDHPFPLYRQFHVPAALSTDDEGVSRIDLTHEFVRAVQTYGLGYSDLKQMSSSMGTHFFPAQVCGQLPPSPIWFPHVPAIPPENETDIYCGILGEIQTAAQWEPSAFESSRNALQ
jgi:adenosine deaminase